MALISEELQPWEEWIHIGTICIMGVLMIISAYEVCASSINDQPRIKYRFTAMLYCFVQFLLTLMATVYFLVPTDDTKWRDSVGLFMRLCGVTGRILGVLCGYSFLLTIVKSLYVTPTYKREIPRWFKGFTKIFCLLIIVLDIVLTVIALIEGTSFAQIIFMYCLEIWILLFSIALMFALFSAKKHTLYFARRASTAYSNENMSSPKNKTNQKWNPSSSQFDLNGVSLPTAMNVMDIDGKTMRTQLIDAQKVYKKQLLKINLMIALNFMICIMLFLGGLYLYFTHMDTLTHRDQRFRTPATESFMSSINTYCVYNGFYIVYIVSLLYWLYIPRSCCCDNIAIDSLFYFCCTSTLHFCFELQPSDLHMDEDEQTLQDEANEPANRLAGSSRFVYTHDSEGSADFDFFNFDTWRSTFRLTSYRGVPDTGDTSQEQEQEQEQERQAELMTGGNGNGVSSNRQNGQHEQEEEEPSLTFDEHGDKDYHEIATARSPVLPNLENVGIPEPMHVAVLSHSASLVDIGSTKLRNENASNSTVVMTKGDDEENSVELTTTVNRDARGISAFSTNSTNL